MNRTFDTHGRGPVGGVAAYLDPGSDTSPETLANALAQLKLALGVSTDDATRQIEIRPLGWSEHGSNTWSNHAFDNPSADFAAWDSADASTAAAGSHHFDLPVEPGQSAQSDAEQSILADVRGGKGGGGGGGHGKPTSSTGDTAGSTSTGDTSGSTSGSTGGSTTTDTNTGTTDPTHYVSGLDTPNGYNLELVFDGSWSNAAKTAIEAAAERISDIITGDIPSFNGVDDARIYLYSETIDGSGGTLAQGGWRTLRSDSMRLVAEGGVHFDSADLDSQLSKGHLGWVAFHEMLHAIGFGTTWAKVGLTATVGGTTRFVGSSAITAYNDYYSAVAANDSYSTKGVLLSSDGAHWNQSSFGSEIMSPSLTSNEILSPMTVAALHDMGYQTHWDSVQIA